MIIIMLVFIFFCVFPMLSVPVSMTMMFLDRKKAWVYLILISISIALPALYFIPQINDDAYRIFSMMQQFSTTSFTSLLGYYQGIGAEYANYPGFLFLEFLVQKTGNYHLLSFICTLVTYFCFLLPVTDLYKRKKVNFGTFLLLFLMVFCWNNYHYTISGMRFQMASGIVYCIFYFETEYLRSKIRLFLYIIPVLIHPGVLPLIIIRLLYPLLRTLTGVKKINSILIFAIAFGVLPTLSSVLGNGGGGYFLGLVQKAVFYSSNDAFHLTTPQMVVRIVVSFIIGIFTLLQLSNVGLNKKSDSPYITVSQYYIIVSLLTSFMVNLANRFELILIPIIAVLFVKIRSRIHFKLIIDMFCLIILMYGIVYNFNIDNSPFYFPKDFVLNNIFSMFNK